MIHSTTSPVSDASHKKKLPPVRSIHRDGKKHPYFSMCRDTAQDKQLSWAARGVLAYLLSKPDDWEVKPADLQQNCGRDKVYSILNELKEARYLTLEAHINEKNKFTEFVYVIHEYPLPEKPETENTEMEKPLPDFPDTAKPDTENPHLTYKRIIQNTESTEDSDPKPLPEPIQSKGDSAAKHQREPQPHMKPIMAFIDTFGKSCLPPDVDLGSFASLSKRMFKKNVAPEVMACAGEAYRVWYESVEVKPILRWTVGEVTEAARVAYALCQRGATPDQIRAFVRDKYGEVEKGKRFWAGKVMSFKYVADHIGATVTPVTRRLVEVGDGLYEYE